MSTIDEQIAAARKQIESWPEWMQREARLMAVGPSTASDYERGKADGERDGYERGLYDGLRNGAQHARERIERRVRLCELTKIRTDHVLSLIRNDGTPEHMSDRPLTPGEQIVSDVANANYERGKADGSRETRERIERRVAELDTRRVPRSDFVPVIEVLQLIRADGTEYPELCSQPDKCRAAGRCVRTPSVCNE